MLSLPLLYALALPRVLASDGPAAEALETDVSVSIAT
jgi:hypothetical protein